MVGKALSVFFFLTMTFNAAADVKVYLAPAGWVRSTDSTDEIRSYLRDLNSDSSVKDTTEPENIYKEIDKYRQVMEDKVSDMFTKNEYSFYDKTVCKISITTGNTSLQDQTPPEVVTIDSLAENKSPACIELTSKLSKEVNGSPDLKYPPSIKKYGLLSMDFIFSFRR